MFDSLPQVVGLLGIASTVLAAPHATTKRDSKVAAVDLPSPSQFTSDKGTKWDVQLAGPLEYTGTLGKEGVNCDKARSSYINGKHMWNMGDMECSATWCGFSMGPTFPGTSDILTVDTLDHPDLNGVDFVSPWSGDEVYNKSDGSGCNAWGMDNSNAAPISDTQGERVGGEN